MGYIWLAEENGAMTTGMTSLTREYVSFCARRAPVRWAIRRRWELTQGLPLWPFIVTGLIAYALGLASDYLKYLLFR
jgi:hypothetical protein